jgi:hypothetical protein
VERNRKVGQNPPKVVVPIEEEEKEEDSEGLMMTLERRNM